jgi:hypothetical protein
VISCLHPRGDLHYVELDAVVSKVGTDPKQNSSDLELQDYVKIIELSSIAQLYAVESDFQDIYWIGLCALDTVSDNNRIILCKPRKNLDDRLIPFTKLQVTKNPDLYNLKWFYCKHLLIGKTLYLSLSIMGDDTNLMSHKLCLAIFRLDEQNNTFVKKVSELFVIPPQLPTMDPGCNEVLGIKDFSIYELMCIKHKVFSLSLVDSSDNSMWVHCFHRDKIVPISGASTKVPGFYQLNPMSCIQFEYYDGRVVGIFGAELDRSGNDKDRVYKTCKYVIV